MVAKKIPPGIERVIEVPLDAGAQVVQPAQEGEHLSGNRGRLDSASIHAVLPRDLSGESRGHRPVPGLLRIPDKACLCIEAAEIGIGRIGWSVALLSRDHLGHSPSNNLPQHRPDPGLADRALLKFCQHLSLSCLDSGQQVGRPLYRVGEELGAERNGQKCRRAMTPDFFGPAAPEMEDMVSANQVQTPFSAGDTWPASGPM